MSHATGLGILKDDKGIVGTGIYWTGCRGVWLLQKTMMAAEESGGCRGIFWLRKSLVATEDGWLQGSLVATEDYGGCRGVWWLQRSLLAAECLRSLGGTYVL